MITKYNRWPPKPVGFCAYYFRHKMLLCRKYIILRTIGSCASLPYVCDWTEKIPAAHNLNEFPNSCDTVTISNCSSWSFWSQFNLTLSDRNDQMACGRPAIQRPMSQSNTYRSIHVKAHWPIAFSLSTPLSLLRYRFLATSPLISELVTKVRPISLWTLASSNYWFRYFSLVHSRSDFYPMYHSLDTKGGKLPVRPFSGYKPASL